MTRQTSFFQALKLWLLSFVIFGLLAVLLAGQFSFTASVPLERSLKMAMGGWLPWALVTPLIFRLVFRFPLERGKWKTSLPLHLLTGALILGFVIWMGECISPMPPPPGPPPEFFHQEGADKRRPDDFPAPMPSPGSWAFFQLRLSLPIYLALISIAHAFHFYRRGKERERQSLSLEANLAKARLEALRMQLQPHFLFNALNAIAELIHKDPDTADRMVVALSDLLRAALETAGAQELPLHREVDVLEKYLSIERVRLGDRLQASINIPPDLRQALVPTLLLQPIVENAVRHGLEPRPGSGVLIVSALKNGAQLQLTISDDGLGLPEGKILGDGIGLGNTKARLEELYGRRASINLRQGKEGKGVTVEVLLPFHENSWNYAWPSLTMNLWPAKG